MGGLKRVYLTFDDGPHSPNTPHILNILKEHGAKATFFVIGSFLPYYSGIAKKAAARGHSVQNHTYSHHNLKALTEEQVALELVSTNTLIGLKTGERPTLYRPPFGATSEAIREVAKKLCLKEVLWDIDPQDYDGRTAKEIHERVVQSVEFYEKPIVLFHDYAHATVEALPRILKDLAKMGYEFRRLS